MTVQSPPQPGAPPPPKKGIGPLGWIGIGCGVIVIIGFVIMGVFFYLIKTKVADPLRKNPGMVLAKGIVAANPDLELVSSDDAAQTLTVHNRKTNETVTLNLDDVKNGRFKLSSDGKGTASVDINQQGIAIKSKDEKGQEATFVAGAGAPKDLPAWLPAYPGATVAGGLSSKSGEASSQIFSLTTADGVDRVIAFYSDQLKNNGLTVLQPTTLAVGGQTSMSTLTADSPDRKRHVQIVAQSVNGKSQVSITCEEKP
ncbi:MAG TPA: hypothetical protein VMW75_20665 [Thermoanaerobaculia bacterium]|nr:hypothetical protein [Thermoanaerobaculia bacterium]